MVATDQNLLWEIPLDQEKVREFYLESWKAKF